MATGDVKEILLPRRDGDGCGRGLGETEEGINRAKRRVIDYIGIGIRIV